MKKLIALLPMLALLASCGDISSLSSSSISSSKEDTSSYSSSSSSEETSSSSSNDSSSSSSSSIDDASLIYLGSLSGMKNDDSVLDFFNAGWSMAGGNVDDNQFKIKYGDGTGYLRTPAFSMDAGTASQVQIKMHITNFNGSDNSACLGQTLGIKVMGVDVVDGEESIIETYEYSHVIDQSDVDAKTPSGIPAYSSDFSSGTFNVNFAKAYSRVKINLTSRLQISEKSGCNLAINEIKVVKA